MVVKTFKDMMKGIQAQVEANRKAAEEHSIKVEDLRHGDYFAYNHPAGITIFGEVMERTDYPEDEMTIALARQNGYVYGRCYSEDCPEGELGDTHVIRITHKVTKEMFDRAKANGFRHIDIMN